MHGRIQDFFRGEGVVPTCPIAVKICMHVIMTAILLNKKDIYYVSIIYLSDLHDGDLPANNQFALVFQVAPSQK